MEKSASDTLRAAQGAANRLAQREGQTTDWHRNDSAVGAWTLARRAGYNGPKAIGDIRKWLTEVLPSMKAAADTEYEEARRAAYERLFPNG